MSFVKTETFREVGSDGPRTAAIVVVGEAPGAEEDRLGKPFMGRAGRVLEQCLHSAGLIRSHIYLTNVVHTRPNSRNDISKFYNKKTGRFTVQGWESVERLRTELERTEAQVIVPAGNVALTALTSESFESQGFSKINTYRGYLMESALLPGRYILPTIHPASSLYGAYLDRYYISHDLQKAKGISELDPDQLLWTKTDIIVPETSSHAISLLRHIQEFCLIHKEALSFDIEVVNYEVSCIGFAYSSHLACSIPFYQTWTEEEEVRVWNAVAKLLQDERITKVGQNITFDISFLALRNGILVRGPIKDTMLLHRIMYPDFPSGLNFLASVYTNRPYWKGMVKFKNIKKES